MKFLMLVSVFVLTLNMALADKFEMPKVDYSATNTMETGEHKIKMKIFYSPGKQRSDMGEGISSIIRFDKKLMWQLMNGASMYMESAIDTNNEDDITNYDIQRTVVGKETVNGFSTTKYKVIATSKQGKKFGGFFWVTPEGINIKMDLLYKEGEKKMRMAQELSDLKIAKQPSSLFEIPAGFSKAAMGGMMPSSSSSSASKKSQGGGRPNMKDLMKKAKEGNIDFKNLMGN